MGGCSSKGGETPPMGEGRVCTDIFCLLFFLAACSIGILIFAWGVSTGDTNALFYDADYLGNRCGVGTMASKPKTYFPRMDQDILAQSAIAATMPWKVNFYGLCMEDCPNVSSPTACFASPGACAALAPHGSTTDGNSVARRVPAVTGSPSVSVAVPFAPLSERRVTNSTPPFAWY